MAKSNRQQPPSNRQFWVQLSGSAKHFGKSLASVKRNYVGTVDGGENFCAD
jgi:hypothetical protein